jgi:two-component system, cell cycle sensor histidine kinase and response regulator CckA
MFHVTKGKVRLYMSKTGPPTFDEEDQNSPSKPYLDAGGTETIDLISLLRPPLTDSGSFDMGEVKYEALGRLLEAIPLPVFLVDPSLRIRLMNHEAQRTLGESRPVIGSSLPSYFRSPKVRKKVLSALNYTFEQRKALIVGGLLKIGPSAIWGRMHVRAVRIGQHRLALVLIEDQTAAKELGVTQKYRKLVHLVPMGIAEFKLQESLSRDRDAAEALNVIMDARLVDGNRSFATLYGYKTIEELHGLALEKLFPFHAKGPAYYRSWIEKGCPNSSVETTEDGADEDLRYFEDTLISNVEDNRVLGIWAVRRDITRKRRLEDRVRRSEKMEALGSLAGGIAHEIRNPLGICSSAAQFLMEDDISPEFRKECAEKIRLSLDRASEIIENLLRFARPRTERDLAPVRLIPVVREALKMAVDNRKEFEIQFSTSDCADEEVVVAGSAGLLHQVFVNLFLNAIGAMPDGGQLKVSVEESASEFLVRISDTGYGIQEKDLPRIFDPFYSAALDRKGMGLGLSIVYSIVKEHSGTVEVQSEYHKGSTFTVRLPRFGI